MLVSLSMMKRFLGEGVDIDELMHKIEHHLEVEVEEVYDIVKNFYDVVVGRIVDRKGKGYIVDIGKKTIYVSSFGNTDLPRYLEVPVAPVGSVIGDSVVEKRGEYEGIIPTLSMLNIPDVVMLPSEGGVPIFPYDIEVGTPLEIVLGLPDKVFDLYIAPPRGDLGSVWGFVRELGRVFGVPISRPQFPTVNIGKGEIVEVESLDDAPIYVGVLIKGVRIDESPWEFQRTLAYLGVRPIYNVVDVTNYYLTVYGQPMHAFDYDKLRGGKIVVRRARDGEKITTLDGVDRTLDPDILVIADTEASVAIAGVMGGENTEVTEDTENIFLEVAYFSPMVVARSSRKLSLRTDASYRFERGIDPATVSTYAKMAAEDIVEIAGGHVVSFEKIGQEWDEKVIHLNIEKANTLVGKPLDWIATVNKLGFRYDNGKVKVPSFRHDLNITEDIVDEVVKKWGYEAVSAELPTYSVVWDPDDEVVLVEQRLAHDFAAHGLMEVWTLSLMDPDIIAKARVGQGVSLLNPVSKLYSTLRPHLLPSLLMAQLSNESYGVDNVFLFEIGKIFPDLKEQRQVGVLISGNFILSDWRRGRVPADFFFLKGILEDVFRRWGIKAEYAQNSEIPYLHPGRAADIVVDGEKIGVIGDVHPDIVDDFDLKNRPVVAFLDFTVFQKYMARVPKAKVPVKSPPLWRDISMIVPKNLPVSSVIDAIKNAAPYLEQITVFDVFEDEEKLGVDSRSVAVRLVFRKPDGAIGSEEADDYMEKIYNILESMKVIIRR